MFGEGDAELAGEFAGVGGGDGVVRVWGEDGGEAACASWSASEVSVGDQVLDVEVGGGVEVEVTRGGEAQASRECAEGGEGVSLCKQARGGA